jgi:ABC-type Fe3+/spermidine/putrescine transport system ATPase subunit
VSLRPERARLHRAADAPTDRPHVAGRLEGVTYLGNALVHTVALDWMRIEVREENRLADPIAVVGDMVAVSWSPGSVSVVAE